MSSQEESSPKAKPTRKKNKMKEKKAKKTIQLRDLTPTKDVRGGHRRFRGRLMTQLEDPQVPRGGYGIHMTQ